jgi:hypothetical protein
MNNFFNFKIPDFKYGIDWDDFETIVEDNVDNLFESIWQLYWLNDPDYMSLQAVEKALKALKISFYTTDTLQLKKLRLRKFLTTFSNKASSDIYLDYAESIVGIRGVIYTGYTMGVWRWGISRRSDVSSIIPESIRWTSSLTKFNIYIDVKTTDSDLLDVIVELYRLPYLYPAFYKIYLIDSNFTILRTV